MDAFQRKRSEDAFRGRVPRTIERNEGPINFVPLGNVVINFVMLGSILQIQGTD